MVLFVSVSVQLVADFAPITSSKDVSLFHSNSVGSLAVFNSYFCTDQMNLCIKPREMSIKLQKFSDNMFSVFVTKGYETHWSSYTLKIPATKLKKPCSGGFSFSPLIMCLIITYQNIVLLELLEFSF